MTERTSRRPGAAGVAAIVAAVGLVATIGTAAVVAVAEADGPDRSSPDTTVSTLTAPSESATPAFRDGQTLYGDTADNLALDVPSGADDWELTDIGDAVTFKTEDGADDFSVLGPALYAYESCPRDQSALGYVGLVTPIDDDGRGIDTVADRAMELFLYGETAGDKGEPKGSHTKIETSQVELPDGTAGVLQTSTASLARPDRCEPLSVEVSVVTVDSGAYYSTVVLGRALEYPSGFDARNRKRYPLMTDDTRDRILASIRLQNPPTATSTVEPSQTDTADPDEGSGDSGDEPSDSGAEPSDSGADE